MKKRITGLFAATLLALSMMAVPAMADHIDLPPKCEDVQNEVGHLVPVSGGDYDCDDLPGGRF